jgi:branched-chain amino acid transport system ATP-binding protein
LASSIEVSNVDAGYGSVRVLHNVSMTANDGETVVLLGSNGNGKSTLIRCIAGLVTPDAGRIILKAEGKETNLVGLAPEEIVGLGVALVPEGRRLFPALTVEENLMLGAYRSAARRNIRSNLDFVFTAFPVLAQRKSQLAGSMSGGEQQMVAVARALMSEPKLLLVSRMIAKIKELKEQRNLTVLMAEQNFNQAIKIADRGYVIVHGEIEFEGKTAADLANNDIIKQYYLGT